MATGYAGGYEGSRPGGYTTRRAGVLALLALGSFAAGWQADRVVASARGRPDQDDGARRADASRGSLMLPLEPVNGSASYGSISLEGDRETERVSLTVKLSGLAPGATYQAQLHAGPAEQPSASVGRLGGLTAGTDGRASLPVWAVRASAAGAVVPLSLSLLSDGERRVTIVSPTGGPIATAALPRTLPALAKRK